MLSELIARLGINVPVLHHQVQDGIHTLYLYGGRVVTCPVETAAAADLVDSVTTMETPARPGHQVPDTSMAPAAAPAAEDSGTTLPPNPKSQILNPAQADFTIVRGLGAAANTNLHAAGFHSWTDVRNADDHTLLHALTTYQLAKLRDYLDTHRPSPQRSNLPTFQP